ncbi:hypothetical protein ACFSJY_16670 [Thalassotalea euphylliae]|uniref:hypothetical protein n=1 Tax=Thalassotalea euphylliae TaxID=1655234 RepID=UPI00363B49E9
MKPSFVALLIISLTALIFGFYRTTEWLSPKVTLKNQGTSVIESAKVYLPSNTLSFDRIGAGESITILRSSNQADGSYRYIISLSNGETLIGNCGYVTNSEFAITQQIVVLPDNKVACFYIP